jgi:hypothetical protein
MKVQCLKLLVNSGAREFGGPYPINQGCRKPMRSAGKMGLYRADAELQ